MSKKVDSIVIRSWPKVIFLWPVVFACFLCGFFQLWDGDENPNEWAGAVFFAVLSLNLLVISFEFSRFKTMAIAFFFFAVFFFLLYLSKDYEIFGWISDHLKNVHIFLSTSFYFWLGIYLLIIFCIVFVTTRFDFWEIKSNEILHKEGFLGDVKRFPSPNLRMSKEIPDVFEFLLTGAGRIVLNPASERQAIVLDHVLRVNTVEKRVQDLLSSLSVEIHTDSSEDGGSDMGIGV